MELCSHANPSAPHMVTGRLMNDPAHVVQTLPRRRLLYRTHVCCALLSAVPDQPSCAGARKLGRPLQAPQATVSCALQAPAAPDNDSRFSLWASSRVESSRVESSRVESSRVESSRAICHSVTHPPTHSSTHSLTQLHATDSAAKD